MTRLLARFGAPFFAAVLSSCAGVVGDPGAAGTGPGSGDGPFEDVTVDICRDRAPAVGPAPLLRLTRRQYGFTLHDALSVDAPIERLPVDANEGGFAGSAGPPIEAQSVTRYAEVAREVVASADLSHVFSCAEDSCADALLDAVGARLFRRPLAAEEHARYATLFTTSRTELALGVGESGTLVLEAMLQSPSFLVRMESGVADAPPGQPVLLDALEIASRLSYFLWQSAPDAELLAAAMDGSLDTPDGIESETRRMLGDVRAERSLGDFHWQWLWLRVGDGAKWTTPPDVGAELYADMERETERFVSDVVRNGSFEDLLSASYSYVNESLAELYGLEGVTGAELRRVELPAGERAGIFTQPLFVASHHRTQRIRPVPLGHLVRERVLCEGLPPPPANVPELATDETLSAREIAALHEADPACGGCHRLMDPIGFAWSSFDRFGRFHATDAEGASIDASGEVVDAEDASGTVDGVVELAHLLAGSEKVRNCYADSWFAFALGRALVEADSCSRAIALERFEASGHRIEELLLGIVTSDAFRYRAASAPNEEVCE